MPSVCSVCHDNGGCGVVVVAIMLKLLGSLREFVKREPVTIDGAVFRLHVSFTTVVLLACSLMVTATQLVGNPMQCIVDSLPYKPVNTYCWISSTFTMPDSFLREHGVDVAHPGVGPVHGGGGTPPKYYTYYQWVCFVLFFQAMMCYAPKWVWDLQEGGLLKALVKNLHTRLGDEKEKEIQKKKLIHYILTHVRVSIQFFNSILLKIKLKSSPNSSRISIIVPYRSEGVNLLYVHGNNTRP